jgi:hypothetical protein
VVAPLVLAFLDITEDNQPSVSLHAELDQFKERLEMHCRLHLEAPTAASAQQLQQPQLPQTGSVKGMLSAVHTELDQQRRRRRNIMVRGLKPVNGVHDADLFAELCEVHLLVKPAFVRVRCHRLGKKQPGKIQPLLMVLRSDENAAEILQCAKLLKDVHEAAGIYINPDLTQAEAQAAFEKRQYRRQRRPNLPGERRIHVAAGGEASTVAGTSYNSSAVSNEASADETSRETQVSQSVDGTSNVSLYGRGESTPTPSNVTLQAAGPTLLPAANAEARAVQLPFLTPAGLALAAT